MQQEPIGNARFEVEEKNVCFAKVNQINSLLFPRNKRVSKRFFI